NGKAVFPCDECPSTFSRKHDLKRHKITHLGDRPVFKCSWCGRNFGRRDALQRH
ncbi:hypothetical protein BC831DRAFT_386183, partial [Entophlyctis helioformis]